MLPFDLAQEREPAVYRVNQSKHGVANPVRFNITAVTEENRKRAATKKSEQKTHVLRKELGRGGGGVGSVAGGGRLQVPHRADFALNPA